MNNFSDVNLIFIVIYTINSLDLLCELNILLHVDKLMAVLYFLVLA